MGIIVSACPTSKHVSADAEHVCLSAGTVLVSAIPAFGYLAINEESHFRHRDDVRMAFLLLYDKMY
jgi:hypothetical protein